MQMRHRVSVLALLATMAWPLPAPAQPPTVEVLLGRVAAYVQTFIDNFTNVVAEETYEQSFRQAAPRRRLKSDFLLVGYPGKDRTLLTFRDVIEVNGRPLAGKDDRITRLFVQPFSDAVRRADEIRNEGAKQSIDRGRLMDPLQVITYLQEVYQKDFTFSLGRLDASAGPDVRMLNMEAVPDVDIRTGRRSPIEGTVWVSETSGRVLRTEWRTGVGAAARFTRTTFGVDRALGIDVPVEMRDTVPLGMDEFVAIARYSNFRRFSVHVEETIETPPNPQ
jgi:hypothetical protein